MSPTTIQLKAPGSEIFVPNGLPVEVALKRTTHLAIGAHPDDLEIMAYHGILECFGKKDRGFAGVIVSDGSGSARDSHYKNYTDQQMVEVRKVEQKKAAMIGEYTAQFLLNHPSAPVKENHPFVAADLDAILNLCHPQVVYTHNLADKHDTHVAVVARVIAALRRLPENKRPQKVIGCEVWRNMDWLCDPDKVLMSVDGHESLADALLGVFDSQICGAKRYDLATRGRRLANATFFETVELDKHQAIIWGMDLTPLIQNPSLDLFEYVKTYMDRFSGEVKERIGRMRG